MKMNLTMLNAIGMAETVVDLMFKQLFALPARLSALLANVKHPTTSPGLRLPAVANVQIRLETDFVMMTTILRTATLMAETVVYPGYKQVGALSANVKHRLSTILANFLSLLEMDIAMMKTIFLPAAMMAETVVKGVILLAINANVKIPTTSLLLLLPLAPLLA